LLIGGSDAKAVLAMLAGGFAGVTVGVIHPRIFVLRSCSALKTLARAVVTGGRAVNREDAAPHAREVGDVTLVT
jgi:hypothetical protein